MKMRMDIENLLRWAFVHELAKGGGVDGLSNVNSAWRKIEASSWGKINSFAELGTLVDTGSGGTGMWLEQGEPHRDAVLIGEAVRDLAGMEIGGFAEWDAFADVPHLAEHLGEMPRRVESRLAMMPGRSRSTLPMTLVISAAVTGHAPDWRWPEEPRLRMQTRAGRPAWFVRQTITDSFGRKTEVEVNGFDPKRGRPKPAAYRKYEISPDPFPVAISRADWQVWVTCLSVLTDQLAGCLADYEVAPVFQSLAPWVEGEAQNPLRILEEVDAKTMAGDS